MTSLTNFFPSRTMSIYMAKMFLVRTFAILAALVLVLQALDLLSESGRILAHAGTGESEVWRYVSLRTPEIIARFLPFSVLLGTLIAFASVSVGVILLRRSRPDLPRGYRVPFYPALPIASAAFCFYLIAGLPVDTYLLFAVWLGGAGVLYFGYSMRRSVLAGVGG